MKTINILSFFKEFLNTLKEFFYKDAKNIVRESFSLNDNITIYLNGYYYKPIKYINENLNLEEVTIPIRRLLVLYGNNKRDTIYLYPSFILKYCPFPLNDLEYVYTECVSKNIEPFDKIDDPDKIMDSSAPYENWVFRICKMFETNKFQEKWSKFFYESFYTLINIEATKIYFKDCLSMIKEFVKKLNIKISYLNLLSYANYQLPFR